jgi:hypothetical protein
MMTSGPLPPFARGNGVPQALDRPLRRRSSLSTDNHALVATSATVWVSASHPLTRTAYADTPEGAAARDRLANVANVQQRKVNEMVGAELGYRYVDSPIVDDIPGGPEHLLHDYHPTAWPGARLPHVWLSDGTPVLDHVPIFGFTLLGLSERAATAPIEAAFRARGVPLQFANVRGDTARGVYERDIVLVRPDLHVVWRSDQPPPDSDRLAAVAAGFSDEDTFI